MKTFYSPHGGDVYSHTVSHDFSVNINPLPLPAPVVEAVRTARWDRYPQYGNRFLREALAQVCALSPEQVLCGNGASELFAAIVHALRPVCAAAPVPSFSGYAWAAQMTGAFRPIFLRRADGFAVTADVLSQLDGVDLLFLANPNNPTGRCIDDGVLFAILQGCEEKGIYVVADECFFGFTGRAYLPLLQRYSHLILVRAFTKLYGVPGLRLGYLLASDILCRRIGRQLPEWNISAAAQAVGLAILDGGWDREGFLRETVRQIRQERHYLSQELTNSLGEKGTVFPSEVNFLLLETELPLYERLLARHILIRDCSGDAGLGTGYYRIAVRSHAENEVLVRALREELS